MEKFKVNIEELSPLFGWTLTDVETFTTKDSADEFVTEFNSSKKRTEITDRPLRASFRDQIER